MENAKQELNEKSQAILSVVMSILNNNPGEVYRFIKNTSPECAEMFAGEFSKNVDKFENIAKVERKGSYDAGHTGETEAKGNDRSNRSEKVLAINLFMQCEKGKIHSGTIGKIFDYEVPLSKEQKDVPKPERQSYGDIDLVSQTDNSIYLIELKREDNTETLLRCILEIYTYYKQLQHEKFIADFLKSGKLKNTLEIKKAVLVFADGTAHKQYKDKCNNANTLLLMEKLGVEMFVLNRIADDYEVTKP